MLAMLECQFAGIWMHNGVTRLLYQNNLLDRETLGIDGLVPLVASLAKPCHGRTWRISGAAQDEAHGRERLSVGD